MLTNIFGQIVSNVKEAAAKRHKMFEHQQMLFFVPTKVELDDITSNNKERNFQTLNISEVKFSFKGKTLSSVQKY